MIPYSFFFLLPFAILFESYDVYVWTMNKENALLPFVAIITSGVLAFGLNFSLYAVIKVTSAVTFTVVGNFKVMLFFNFFFKFSNLTFFAHFRWLLQC